MKHLKTLEYIRGVGRSGSIRRAAEQLNITPTALTRKIQDFEHELGTQVFERLPHGMRLNAAGELLVRHIQDQLSDFEQLRSQIADLSGVRRGHVTIACSQGFVDHVLPGEIEAYRREFLAGDFLTIFTDGFSEAMNSARELFGLERLAELCADQGVKPADLGPCILDKVNEFVGDFPQSDDMCLLCFGRE